MISPDKQVRSLRTVIDELHEKEFYGKVIIQMNRGNIVLYRLEQTLTPEAILQQSGGASAFAGGEESE